MTDECEAWLCPAFSRFRLTHYQGDGGMGPGVFTTQGEGGIGPGVFTANHGEGGIGPGVLTALRLIAPVRTTRANTATTNDLLIDSSELQGNYAEELMRRGLPSREKSHTRVS